MKRLTVISLCMLVATGTAPAGWIGRDSDKWVELPATCNQNPYDVSNMPDDNTGPLILFEDDFTVELRGQNRCYSGNNNNPYITEYNHIEIQQGNITGINGLSSYQEVNKIYRLGLFILADQETHILGRKISRDYHKDDTVYYGWLLPDAGTSSERMWLELRDPLTNKSVADMVLVPVPDSATIATLVLGVRH